MRIILSVLFCLLLGLKVSGQGLEYAVADDDELQARIWHQALTWIYQDNNKTAPANQKMQLPTVSSINLKKFENDLKNASATGKDGYNFYQKLFLPAASRLYKPSSELVNSQMLIAEIVKEAGNKEGRNTAELQKVLNDFVSKTKPKPDEIARPESIATSKVAPPVNTQTTLPKNDTIDAKETDSTFLPKRIMDFISVLALALGGLALWRTMDRKPAAASVPATNRNFSTSTGAEVGGSANAKNLNAIHKDIKTLRDEIVKLKRENERLLGMMANEIQEVRNSVSASQVQTQNSYQNQPPQPTQFQETNQYQAPPQNQIQDLSQPAGYAQNTFDIEDDHLIMETENPEPAFVETNFTKYARVPEDSVIKDRDLHTDKNDNWSFIEVSVTDPNAQTARFRLNPHINHALAINNSLDRLENAFDFPRTANKASTIVNQQDGELVRVPQGWKIERRAKITLQ